MRRTNGLTVVEALMAVLLLGVLIVVVLGPLPGLFGLVRDSDQALGMTTTAQEVIEVIRGQWRDPDRYHRTCLEGVVIPDHVTVTVWALDRHANVTGTLTLGPCGGGLPAVIPPIKRVSVEVESLDGRQRARVTLDIPRPFL
jgi:type II secretory pathway pseudopilin PulG